MSEPRFAGVSLLTRRSKLCRKESPAWRDPGAGLGPFFCIVFFGPAKKMVGNITKVGRINLYWGDNILWTALDSLRTFATAEKLLTTISLPAYSHCPECPGSSVTVQ